MAFSGGSAFGGTAQGASTGAAFGPWGAAIGGAVGGLVGGAFGGAAAKAMAAAKRAAQRIERMQMYRQKVALQRSYAQQRAEVVASAASDGTAGASSTQGALGALGTQANAELGYGNFMWEQQGIIKKANAKAQRSVDTMGLLFGAAKAGTSAYTALSSPPSTPAPTPTSDNTPEVLSFNQTPPQGISFYAADSGATREQPIPLFS